MRATAMALPVLLALGCVGERGDPGPPGLPGPSDTPEQVLEKVNQALAAGGSLDLRRSLVIAARTDGGITVPPSTHVTVPYSTVADDTVGEYDMFQHQFTASHAGEYLVCASSDYPGWMAPWRLDLFINGAPGKSLAGHTEDHMGCLQAHLDMSDDLDVRVIQWTADPQTFCDGNSCWLRIHRID